MENYHDHELNLQKAVLENTLKCPLYGDLEDETRCEEIKLETFSCSPTYLVHSLQTERGQQACARVEHPRLEHRLNDLDASENVWDAQATCVLPCNVRELDQERSQLSAISAEKHILPSNKTFLMMLHDAREEALSYVMWGVLHDAGCSVRHVACTTPPSELWERYEREECNALCGTAPQICNLMYERTLGKHRSVVDTIVVVGQLRRNQRRMIRTILKHSPPRVIHVYGSGCTSLFAISPPDDVCLYYDVHSTCLQFTSPLLGEVTRSDTQRQLETFENQRYYHVVGWTSQLGYGERDTWSLEDGTTMKRNMVSIPFGWNATGDWCLDPDGWCYGPSFNGPWSPEMEADSKVRRRRWYLPIEKMMFDPSRRTDEEIIFVTRSTRCAIPIYRIRLPDMGKGAEEEPGVFEIFSETPIAFKFYGLPMLTDEFEVVYSRFVDYQIHLSPMRFTLLVINDPTSQGLQTAPTELRETISGILEKRFAVARKQGLLPDDFGCAPHEQLIVDVFIVPYSEFTWDHATLSLPRVVNRSDAIFCG